MIYRKLAWLRRTQADGPVYSKIHLFLIGEYMALCGLSAAKQLVQGKVLVNPGRWLDASLCQRCLKASRAAETAEKFPPVIEFDGTAAGG